MERERISNWCFTLNNYTEEDVAVLQAYRARAKYMVVGREVAPSTSTPHLQGAIWLRNATTLAALGRMLPRAHWTAMRHGGASAAYCSKDGDMLFDDPPPEKAQGRRTDIEVVREMVKAGRPLDEIGDVVGAQAFQFACKLQSVQRFRSEWLDDKQVIWIHGPSGVGKTTLAYKMVGPDRYEKQPGKWWCGYSGEEAVLMDEFRHDWIEFHQVLKWLDKRTFRAEVKNAQVAVTAKLFVITTPYSPESAFAHSTDEDIKQLKRRITKVIDMTPTEEPMGEDLD